MSQPASCCYYFPTPSPVISTIGTFETDEFITRTNHQNLAISFALADNLPGSSSYLGTVVSTLCSSNLTDPSAATAYLNTLVSQIVSSGVFTNRDGSPVSTIQAAISYGDWSFITATVGTNETEPVGAEAFSESFNAINPITGANENVLWVKVPILYGCKLAIHIVAVATRNPDYIPCQPSPPTPPDDCTLLCEDEEDDDCEDDEECVNVYARRAPRQFFGGVYRFA